MLLLHRLLYVLVLLRLLAPPGICLCKLTAPVADRLAQAMRGEPPPAAPAEPDDDHAPGCPASCLAPGMWVKPPAPSLPPALVLDWLPPEPSEVPALLPAAPAAAEYTVPIAGGPRYLALCALLI